jgi:signal transduction histidine kinase
MGRRITHLIVVVACLAVVLFAVPLAAVASAYLLGDERAELERAADIAAITVAAQIGAGRPVTTLVGAGRDPAAQLALYDEAGRRLLGEGPASADEIVRGAGAAIGGDAPVDGTVGDELVVAVPVSGVDSPPMTVRAATSRWEVYRSVGVVGLGMLLLAVLALATAWFFARRLSERLTRPLAALSRAARRLGDGDFTARGPVSGIPEIDGVGRALDDTADRIDRVLARERAFSADVSHQLRTPLAGLRLGLEAAWETPGTDLHAAVGTAIGAADRLHAIVEDLLALARDTHRTGVPLDLDQLVANTRDRWQGSFAAAARGLIIHRDQEAPPSRASAAAVGQIIDVLVDNALTHGRGAVTVTLREAAGALAVDVVDEGPGVSAEASLFTRRSPGAAGHGIGLALARDLAEAEDGRLQLSRPSPPTFTLLLPVSTEAEGADPVPVRSAVSR